MSFYSPWYLIGLVSILVPIVIHLFNFRKPKLVFFSNLRFVKNATIEVNKNQKIKHLLILIARILFLFFLVMAFARPYFETDTLPTNIIGIYLDNTQSMQVNTGESDMLSESVKKLQDNLANAPSNARFLFLDADFKQSDENILSREQLKDRLTEIGFSDKSRTLEDAHKKLLVNAQRLGVEKNIQVYMMSDLQKSSFKEFNFPVNIRTQILSSNPKNISNAYIDTAFLENPIVLKGEQIVLKVVVVNSGDEELLDMPVNLNLEGVQIGSAKISLGAQQKKIVEFKFLASQKSYSAYKVTIEDHSLSFDNSYNLVIQSVKPLEVVVISSQYTNTYNNIFSKDETYNLKTYDFRNINYGELKNADMLIIDGLEEANSTLVSIANELVNAHKTVVVNPGLGFAKISLQQNLTELGFKGVNVRKDTIGVSAEKVQLPDLKDPFFQGIYKSQQNNVILPNMKVICEVSGKEVFKTNFNKQAVSILEKNGGKIVVITSPNQLTFTDFYQHPFFVTLLLKLSLSGTNLSVPLSYTMQSREAKFTMNTKAVNSVKLKSDKEELNVELLKNGVVELNKLTIKPNIYKIIAQDSVCGYLAINSFSEESDLKRYKVEELKDKLKQNTNIGVEVYDTHGFENIFQNGQNYGFQIWKICLILALIFLFVEILLIRSKNKV
ncbi:MAG: BatA domain-containing protein [Cytophagales bacterium]